MSQAKAFLLRTNAVKQFFQHPHLVRKSQAKHFSTPWWISDARSPTSHFSKDVSGESFTLKNQRRKTTPPNIPFIVRKSQARRFSKPCWIFDARSPTSHLSEDVSGESFRSEDQRRKRAPTTSPFCHDVSGETLVQTMSDERRPISSMLFFR